MDRGPEVQQTLRIIGPQLHGVRAGAIRFLEPAAGGAAVVLVPTERFADDQDPAPHYVDADNPLCVVYAFRQSLPTPIAGAGLGCWHAVQIRAGKASAYSAGEGGMHLFGLVPDGVARVAVDFRDATTRTAEVRDNFYDVLAPAFPGGVVKSTRWLDAAGADVSPSG